MYREGCGGHVGVEGILDGHRGTSRTSIPDVGGREIPLGVAKEGEVESGAVPAAERLKPFRRQFKKF